ncbi:MAG: hypothetical protein IPP33_04045 [Flavobacteriales bacterium]|nr:hypothetical protein [Flavobacteriales bacterium]
MRNCLFLAPMVLVFGCTEPAEKAVPELKPLVISDTTMEVDPSAIVLVPLTTSGVKFDGVYHYSSGNLKYYMRFFERGNAAFVGGTEKYQGQLAEMLTIDVRSGWNQVHNCPVDQRNDSLFIRSMSIKGAINYAGEVRANGDSLSLLRSSEINGTRMRFNYVFLPDVFLQQEKAKFVEVK